MANVPLLSFNAGVLSPQIDARSDVAKYASGCRTLSNMIPRIYGSAERRPGTQFIGSVKNASEKSRLVSFQYSDTIAYIAEFGPEYIRFFFDGGRVIGAKVPTNWADDTAYIIGQFVTYSSVVYRCLVAHTSDATDAEDGDHEKPIINFTDWVVAALDDGYPIAETPTPYQESDLFELQIRQSADVMWIVHPDYAPRKLTRTTTTSFDLSIINFTNGPFLPRNDLENADGITITPSATTGSITLTASAAVFDSAHISAPGALFKITHARATTETSGSSADPTTGVIGSAIDIKGTFSFNTHGTWDMTVKLERNENEEGWETFRTFISNSDRNIQFTGNEEADSVQYRINVSSSTSGTLNADLTVNNSTESGICRIDTFISTTEVTATYT